MADRTKEIVTLNTLVDAKQEWTHHLTALMRAPVVTSFHRMADDAEKIVAKRGGGRTAVFKQLLGEVGSWGSGVLDQECEVIDQEDLEKVLRAVFVANTVVLSSIRSRADQSELQVNVPNCKKFIHEVFTQCADAFAQEPNLFIFEGGLKERVYKRDYVDRCVEDVVKNVVRQNIPIGDLVTSFLDDVVDMDIPARRAEPRPEPRPEARSEARSETRSSDTQSEANDEQKNFEQLVNQAKVDEVKRANFDLYNQPNEGVKSVEVQHPRAIN